MGEGYLGDFLIRLLGESPIPRDKPKPHRRDTV